MGRHLAACAMASPLTGRHKSRYNGAGLAFLLYGPEELRCQARIYELHRYQPSFHAVQSPFYDPATKKWRTGFSAARHNYVSITYDVWDYTNGCIDASGPYESVWKAPQGEWPLQLDHYGRHMIDLLDAVLRANLHPALVACKGAIDLVVYRHEASGKTELVPVFDGDALCELPAATVAAAMALIDEAAKFDDILSTVVHCMAHPVVRVDDPLVYRRVAYVFLPLVFEAAKQADPSGDILATHQSTDTRDGRLGKEA